jgi:hypothetical protein
MARQQQGEIATFNYQDNMSKGVQRTWEIMLKLIPKIYDTQRQLRILGPDDSETLHEGQRGRARPDGAGRDADGERHHERASAT